MRFDDFRPGEVNRAREVHWCASGKVLNVAVALAHLGAPVEVLSAVGGTTGAQIEAEFAAAGIPSHFVHTAWPTRVCTTILPAGILPAGQSSATELVENAGPLTAAELEEFTVEYRRVASRAALVVLSGSLPQGAPPDLYRELLQSCDCPAILDARGDELLAALVCRPLLVKPNREELARTVGRPLDSDSDLFAAMRELNDRGAQWVLITQGGNDVWASSAGRFYRFTPPRVSVVNPIGAGDCLAAGIASAIEAGAPMLDAIRQGMAAAADNVTKLLPARLNPQVIGEIVGRIGIAPI